MSVNLSLKMHEISFFYNFWFDQNGLQLTLTSSGKKKKKKKKRILNGLQQKNLRTDFLKKSSNMINFKRIGWILLIVFYSISTLVGYLMPNPLYIYIIYDL